MSGHSSETARFGQMTGESVPCLGRTEQWYADESAEPQIAIRVEPKFRPVCIAITWISDVAKPGTVCLWPFIRNDGQAALRTPIHVGRHRFGWFAIDANDAAAQCVAALGDGDDTVSVRCGPGAKRAGRRGRHGWNGKSDCQNGDTRQGHIAANKSDHGTESALPRLRCDESGHASHMVASRARAMIARAGIARRTHQTGESWQRAE